MSTLTVDDDLYQQASEAAAAQGKTVDQFVGDTLRKALSTVGVRRTVRNGVPVMVVRDSIPMIDPVKVRQHLSESLMRFQLPRNSAGSRKNSHFKLASTLTS
jgi:hypothetical protein